VRVSTGDQALGPEAQRTALLAWCVAQGCTLVHVFVDQAVGGATPADQRPGLSAALAGVKQHGAGFLLVATRDRLARDTLIAALVEQRTQQLGASIRAVDGSGNTDSEAVTDAARWAGAAALRLALARHRQFDDFSTQPPALGLKSTGMIVFRPR
jgi:DNA invertase Pin-like site-specific DNA recombinase